MKAEWAWFRTEEVRRAKPETEPLLTRWGKSGVFSESTALSFLFVAEGDDGIELGRFLGREDPEE